MIANTVLRRARGVAAGIVGAFVVAACLVTTAGAEGVSATPVGAAPLALVLLPRDLPLGYEVGDDTDCGTLTGITEMDASTLNPVLAAEEPAFCIIEVQWAWKRTPRYGPHLVSAAYRFRSEEGARRAFAARDELVQFTAGFDQASRVAMKLGDEAELLRASGTDYSATGIVWRYGNVVSVISVEPRSVANARALAKMQQAHLERPRPAAPALLTNDPALRLDEPAATLPVYWLGRSYDPPGRLPRLTLYRASVGPMALGQRLNLDYTAVVIETWLPKEWERAHPSRPKPKDGTGTCWRETKLKTSIGPASVYEGYDGAGADGPCPTRPADRVIAKVQPPKLFIVVRTAVCTPCAYRTRAGLTSIINALRLRP